LCKYGDAPAYENEDRLLWDPSKMEDKEGKRMKATHVINLVMSNYTFFLIKQF